MIIDNNTIGYFIGFIEQTYKPKMDSEEFRALLAQNKFATIYNCNVCFLFSEKTDGSFLFMELYDDEKVRNYMDTEFRCIFHKINANSLEDFCLDNNTHVAEHSKAYAYIESSIKQSERFWKSIAKSREAIRIENKLQEQQRNINKKKIADESDVQSELEEQKRLQSELERIQKAQEENKIKLLSKDDNQLEEYLEQVKPKKKKR